MAKNLNRKVTVYINGTEIKSTIASLEAALKKLKNEQRNLTIGTEEYVATGKKIREIENIIHQQKAAVHSLNNEWKSTTERVAEAANILMGFQSAMQMIDLGIGKVKDLAKDAAALDDIYADVMKTTGLTHEQVEKLNEAFKKIDTRTSREELNKLAYEAGKLGINSEEAVAGFVSAADKINIALGDVLGDGAMVTIGKLSEVYAKSTYQLAEAGDDIEKKMLAIGSAINMLGQSSTANENYLVEFLGRLGGVATQAGLSADQILGYASALDQDMQKLEMSATAFQRLIGQMIKKPEEFVRAAKMPLNEFKQLMETDMNEAIKRVLQGFNEMGGYTALVPVFKDMGLDGQRAAAAISSMASSLDKVNEAQAIANEELTTGNSVINEFNTKNETMQAKAEKAKKRFEEVRIELGNELYPVLIHLQKTGTVLMKGIAGFVQLVKENKAILPGLILLMVNWLRVKLLNMAADGKLIKTLTSMLGIEKLKAHHEDVLTAKILKKTAAEEKNRLAVLKAELAEAKKTATMKVQMYDYDGLTKKMIAQERVRELEVQVTKQSTVATNANTKSVNAQKAAFSSTPWGLVITALTSIAALTVNIVKNTDKWKISQAIKETARATGEAEGKIKILTERMKKAEEGSAEYTSALSELKQEYPEIIALHQTEEGYLRDIEAAYIDLTEAARKSIKERILLEKTQERYGELSSKKQERIQELLGDILVGDDIHNMTNLNPNLVPEVTRMIGEEIDRMEQYGLTANQVFENINNRLSDYNASLSGLDDWGFNDAKKQLNGLEREIRDFNDYENTLKASLGIKDDGNDPFQIKGKAAEELASELQSINSQIKLQKRLWEDNKDIQTESAQETARNAKENLIYLYRYQAALEAAIKKGPKNKPQKPVTTPDGFDEKEVKKWEHVKERALRMIADFNTKAESGLLKLQSEIRNKRDQMIKDIEESVGATDSQKQALIKQVTEAAAAMERAKISEYVKKQREELEKMRRQLKGSNTNEYLNKIEEAERKLLEQVREIDKNIAAAEQDAARIENEELTRLEEKLRLATDEAVANAIRKEIEENKENLAAIRATIAAYQQLKREFANNVYSGITSGNKRKAKPLSNDESQWSQDTQNLVNEMRGNGYEWLFDEKAFDQYGRALESIRKKYEEQKEGFKKEAEAESAIIQRLTERRNNAIDNASAENDYNEELINDLDRQIEEHEANARSIQHESDELERFNQEAQDAAKEDAFGRAIERWIIGIEKFTDAAMEVWGNLNKLLNNIAQSRIQELEDEKDASIKLLDDQLEQGLISQEEYNEQKEQLDKDYKDKEDEINAEIWERNKAYSISEATISAALAILRVWESKGTVAQHIAETALVAANTALQIAAILNEPRPYAKGGYVERRTVYQAGEAGPEWVASHGLLSDPATAPIIEQLEAYQRGDSRALSNIPMAAIDMSAASSAAEGIGRSHSIAQQPLVTSVTERQTESVGSENREMVRLMRDLNKYMKDPRNRQAVISRQHQEQFETDENFLRSHARLG